MKKMYFLGYIALYGNFSSKSPSAAYKFKNKIFPLLEIIRSDIFKCYANMCRSDQALDEFVRDP